MKKGIAYHIRQILRGSREGMGVTQMVEELAKLDLYPDRETVAVLMSQMAGRGIFHVDKGHSCPTCCHPFYRYRLNREYEERG